MNKSELVEKIYKALENRQKQLDNQIEKIMNKKPISRDGMLVVNAQLGEIQQMIWFIEDLEEESE